MSKALLIFTAMVFVAPLQAAYLAGFAGNTQPTDTSGQALQGYLNASVFDRTGGVEGDSFNLSGGTDLTIDGRLTAAGFNITSSYLYLYQASNNSNVPISSVGVQWNANAVTGFGYVSGYGFAESDGNTSVTNPLGTPASPMDPSPFSNDATGVRVTAQSGLVDPTLVVALSLSLKSNYFTPEVVKPHSTSVFGFTSNSGPELDSASLQGGGASADGFVPTTKMATPEPATAVLILLGGLPAIGVFARRRK